MSDTITVAGPVSFGMQFRATRAVAARTLAQRACYGIFLGLPILVTALWLVAGHDMTEPGAFGLPVWCMLLAGPAFVFLFLPLCHALAVSQMRRGNASMCGVLKFTLGPGGYEVQGDNFEARLQWTAFRKATETKEFFLFFVASQMAHFVPKAFADSPENLETMRTIIRGALGQKAHLRTA